MKLTLLFNRSQFQRDTFRASKLAPMPADPPWRNLQALFLEPRSSIAFQARGLGAQRPPALTQKLFATRPRRGETTTPDTAHGRHDAAKPAGPAKAAETGQP